MRYRVTIEFDACGPDEARAAVLNPRLLPPKHAVVRIRMVRRWNQTRFACWLIASTLIYAGIFRLVVWYWRDSQ